jgi:hypothetical protein
MTFISETSSLCLWYAQPGLHLAAAAALWRRKLHKQFPYFFAFLLVQVANFAITFPFYGNYKWYAWYFWLYWTGEAVNAILGFKVIHEIFLDVFRPYHALKDLGTPVFGWAGAVMMLVSVVVAASNSLGRDPVVQAVTTLERSVHVVQVGLILFLVIFARFLGVSRRQLSFGIALGFGCFSGAELVMLAMYSGRLLGHVHLTVLNMLFYDCAVMGWIAYGLWATVARQEGINPLRTRRWEQSLAELQPGGSADSLIPMFEGMVERAFSHSSRLDVAEDLAAALQSQVAQRTKSATAGSRGRN